MSEATKWWRRTGPTDQNYVCGAVYTPTGDRDADGWVPEIATRQGQFVPWQPQPGDWVKFEADKIHYEMCVEEVCKNAVGGHINGIHWYSTSYKPLLHRHPQPPAPATQGEEIQVGDEVEIFDNVNVHGNRKYNKDRIGTKSKVSAVEDAIAHQIHEVKKLYRLECWAAEKHTEGYFELAWNLRKLSKAPAPHAPGTPLPQACAPSPVSKKPKHGEVWRARNGEKLLVWDKDDGSANSTARGAVGFMFSSQLNDDGTCNCGKGYEQFDLLERISEVQSAPAADPFAPVTTVRDKSAAEQEARRQKAIKADAADEHSRHVMWQHDTREQFVRDEAEASIASYRRSIAALEAKLNPPPQPKRGKRFGWSEGGVNVRGW